MKHTLTLLSILALSLTATANGYLFGLKADNNDPQNILDLEQKYNVSIPIVSLIFDPWNEYTQSTMDTLSDVLGKNRIYHITLSPNGKSAQYVADGLFDDAYRQLFQSIKRQDIRVVFRTMHEMNGGWYPWSSDPEAFKQAWIHVWQISREEGLDQHNILFDMSVNHRDMPTKGDASQEARLVTCKPKLKEKKQCYSFEDYYPGDQYVDLMGVTFYNRGKATSSRSWYTPSQIMYMKSRSTLKRLISMNKPIIVDEVGTTAVYYTGSFDPNKSTELYETEKRRKNLWLTQLKNFLVSTPEIIGAVYFNVDYTNGLTDPTIGEADWTALNTSAEKTYEGIFGLFESAESNIYDNSLLNVFDTKAIQNDKRVVYVKKNQANLVEGLANAAEQYSQQTSGSIVQLFDRAESRISNSQIETGQKNGILEIIQKTKNLLGIYDDLIGSGQIALSDF